MLLLHLSLSQSCTSFSKFICAVVYCTGDYRKCNTHHTATVSCYFHVVWMNGCHVLQSFYLWLYQIN